MNPPKKHVTFCLVPEVREYQPLPRTEKKNVLLLEAPKLEEVLVEAPKLKGSKRQLELLLQINDRVQKVKHFKKHL